MGGVFKPELGQMECGASLENDWILNVKLSGEEGKGREAIPGGGIALSRPLGMVKCEVCLEIHMWVVVLGEMGEVVAGCRL